MKKILLVTGPAGDAQGWGDIKVTKSIQKAINDSGKSARIAFVNNMDEFLSAIEKNSFDIAWSALYHISGKADAVGMGETHEKWVADIFDEKGIPCIGPDSKTMKQLINKTCTHRILKDKGVLVPYHYQLGTADNLPDLVYPAFVKPSFESRSVGISDDSVVHSKEDLKKRIAFIESNFDQPALVEEYLPGSEYTVLMLGNGKHQVFLPGKVMVDPSLFGKYPILRSDLRGVGATKIKRVSTKEEDLIELCRQAMEALNCLDHVRTDMRMDANGKLKIIEVNGIPGLKPGKSWSPQIFSMYYPAPKGPMKAYQNLINHIVSSALARYNL
ncbi:MAG: ATP-grasp domain-containing protein [Deltaproteobacteria bacterium]|nr:ATP-grasp domain-containing protein [Deltaproteobacteria bacterium]